MTKAQGGRDAQFGASLEFMRLLWAVDHGFQATSKWMQATLGVTAQQRLVIRILGLRPEMSAGALAEMLHVHPSTLTGVLQRLQRRGLVRRHADPADGRRVILSLTAKGHQLERTLAGTVEAAVGRTLKRLRPQAVAHTSRTLKVLAEELQRR
jgi:DNA-binding MarR family transcriptional regulator